MKRAWLSLLLPAAATALTPVILHRLPVPFVWIAALWAVALAAGAWSVRTQALRLALVNLAAVALALGGFETYLWLTSPPPDASEVRYSRDYFVPHPVLGYGPRKGVVTEAVKRHQGELVYRVTYTIDPNGLRVTPPAPEAASSVAFFGGSVTFGEGLEDAQSMPYRVAERLGAKTRVYNFGFHGYGAHQMLAAIEQGWAESLVKAPLAAVVYQAIPAHVVRAAGRAPWDIHGPWYRLDDRGRVQLAGRFDQRPGAAAAALLGDSFTFRRIFGLERRVSDADLALFAAIVARARQEAQQRFPGCAFLVLLWDGDEDHQSAERVLAALMDRGISVRRIRDVLPGHVTDPARYRIGPHDKHPNPRAQDLIAAHLVEDLLRPLTAASR